MKDDSGHEKIIVFDAVRIVEHGYHQSQASIMVANCFIRVQVGDAAQMQCRYGKDGVHEQRAQGTHARRNFCKVSPAIANIKLGAVSAW